MRTWLVVSLLLASFVGAAPGYKLVWSDEFDGHGLPDPTKWSYNVGGWGWGNGELQFYKQANPRNAWVDSGVLKITVRLEDTTWTSGKGATTTNHFSSARLVSYGKASWKYGRFQARMKMPRGRGMWPAFWLLPIQNSWPATGEIDILENWGADPAVMRGSVQTKNFHGATSVFGQAMASNPSDSFHVLEPTRPIGRFALLFPCS